MARAGPTTSATASGGAPLFDPYHARRGRRGGRDRVARRGLGRRGGRARAEHAGHRGRDAEPPLALDRWQASAATLLLLGLGAAVLLSGVLNGSPWKRPGRVAHRTRWPRAPGGRPPTATVPQRGRPDDRAGGGDPEPVRLADPAPGHPGHDDPRRARPADSQRLHLARARPARRPVRGVGPSDARRTGGRHRLRAPGRRQPASVACDNGIAGIPADRDLHGPRRQPVPRRSCFPAESSSRCPFAPRGRSRSAV